MFAPPTVTNQAQLAPLFAQQQQMISDQTRRTANSGRPRRAGASGLTVPPWSRWLAAGAALGAILFWGLALANQADGLLVAGWYDLAIVTTVLAIEITTLHKLRSRNASGATIGVCAAAILAGLWVVAIATHTHWGRAHDGPATPISYPLVLGITLIAAVTLLPSGLLGSRRGRFYPEAPATTGAPFTREDPGSPQTYPPQGPGPHSGTKTAGDDLFRQAKQAYAAQEYQTSAERFTNLCRFPAHVADAHYGLGMIALARHQPAQAFKWFQSCLIADRTYANAWYQLSRLAQQRSPENAARYYQQALHYAQHRPATTTTSAATPHPDPPGPAARAGIVDPPAAAPGCVTGRVAGLQRRNEQSFYLHRLFIYVWDFRIERPNCDPILVEMRAFRFTGDVSNGDIVDIPAQTVAPGQVAKVQHLFNRTTNAEITASFARGPRTAAAGAKITGRLAIVIAFLGGVSYVLNYVITHLPH